MSTVKEKYLIKTQQSLLNSQTSANAQRERFRNANYGVNTPIDSKALGDVPNGKVILNQEVFKQLLKVNDESEKAQAEFSYLLTGITEGQTVRFDNVVWCRNQGNYVEADFTPLLPNLNSFVKAVKQTGEIQAIVCNGHTHPKNLSKYADDFSLYDMAGFMQMKEDNVVFRNDDISLCGGIMSNLNFNFCFYDTNMQSFYKFNDVILELETGEQIPLSCYDRKINRNEISNAIQIPADGHNEFIENLKNDVVSLSTQAQNRQRLNTELNREKSNKIDDFEI